MANVSWSLSIQVAGGPTVTAREGPIAAEAISRIEVLIPERSDSGSAGELTVDLQSGPVNGIHFLLIKSSQYGDGRNIVFRTSGDGTTFGGSPITLAGPQFYSGGAVEHLDPDPRFLRFTNNSGEEARIEIFIARDATP